MSNPLHEHGNETTRESQMRRMLRTAQDQGYTPEQLRQLCRTRADTLRNKANEIENLML